MLYNKLIFFLGFYSLNYLPSNKFESYFNSKYINTFPNPPLKNNKKFVDYLETNTISPRFNTFIPEINANNLTNNEKIKIYMYQFYSFLILLLLSIQPIYLLISAIINYNNIEEYLITFLCHINTPINYIWAKNYYKNNHFLKYCNSCSDNCNKCDKLLIFLLFITILSIILNLILNKSFLNNFNCYYYSNNLIITYFLSIFEWIFARCLYSLTTCSFTIIFCYHTFELNQFKKNIQNNNFNMENNYCLSKMISTIAKLKHSIEISTKFYNKIISFITVTGTLSLSLFINHNVNNKVNFSISDNGIYLIQNYILLILFQLIFFINIYRYTLIREDVVKLLQSPSFINQFLTRWSVSKLKKNCSINNCSPEAFQQTQILNYSKISLCIDEENATTLDWFVLEKLINIRWIDFSIMGISFYDVELIKKIIAFSGILLIILGYI